MTKALVTGANRGIGLELCRQLGARGDEVLAACRKPSVALERLDARVLANVDVVDDASVARLGCPSHTAVPHLGR